VTKSSAGPHLPIRSGGADLHFGSGELMKEKRSAPVVHELAMAIYAQAGFFADKPGLVSIATVQGSGNFRIQADGVAAVLGTVAF